MAAASAGYKVFNAFRAGEAEAKGKGNEEEANEVRMKHQKDMLPHFLEAGRRTHIFFSSSHRLSRHYSYSLLSPPRSHARVLMYLPWFFLYPVCEKPRSLVF